jgi:drug/metabolite transporter (DMT)-like permease
VLVAVSGGALAWFEKPVLVHVHPLPLNVVVRLITVVMLVAVTVPLTVFGVWTLGFATPPAAVAYIALAAFLEWAIALTAFYYALRISTISIVTAVVASAPLFTALFGTLFLGERLGTLTIIGVVLTVAGVAVLSRFMPVDDGDPKVVPAGDAVAVAEDGPGAAEAATTRRERRRSSLLVLLPALLAAAAWGVYPVTVDAAEQAAGGPTTTMMIESQFLGAVFLIPLLIGRRARARRQPPPAPARRRVLWFLFFIGILETIWGVFFYFMVEHLGAVITGVIMATAPVFSILGGLVIWHERLGLKAGAGVVLAIAGVFIAALGGAG